MIEKRELKFHHCDCEHDLSLTCQIQKPKSFFYSHFVLLLFLPQVLDNRLQYSHAINALCLQGSLTKQRLHYFVSLERERRIKNSVPDVISTSTNTTRDDSTQHTETSPLTITTDAGSKSTSTTTSSGFGSPRRRKSRRSPRQASIARLDAKAKRDAERRRYSTAFKEATTILANNPISRGETANETIL